MLILSASQKSTQRNLFRVMIFPFKKPEWQKKFAAFEHMRDRITPASEEQLDQAIDTAVRDVRAASINAYEKNPA